MPWFFSVASLLMWGLEFASCEKRQRGRWRPGWGHQEGPGRGFLFFLAKMSQNSIYDVLILNTGDDLYRSTATAANLDIDIEYALESLGPGHRDVSFSGWANFSIGDSFHSFATFGRRDLPTPSVVRCQDAVVSREIDPGFWYECRQPSDEIHRIEGHLCRAIPIGRLQGIESRALAD